MREPHPFWPTYFSELLFFIKFKVILIWNEAQGRVWVCSVVGAGCGGVEVQVLHSLAYQCAAVEWMNNSTSVASRFNLYCHWCGTEIEWDRNLTFERQPLPAAPFAHFALLKYIPFQNNINTWGIYSNIKQRVNRDILMFEINLDFAFGMMSLKMI